MSQCGLHKMTVDNTSLSPTLARTCRRIWPAREPSVTASVAATCGSAASAAAAAAAADDDAGGAADHVRLHRSCRKRICPHRRSCGTHRRETHTHARWSHSAWVSFLVPLHCHHRESSHVTSQCWPPARATRCRHHMMLSSRDSEVVKGNEREHTQRSASTGRPTRTSIGPGSERTRPKQNAPQLYKVSRRGGGARSYATAGHRAREQRTAV